MVGANDLYISIQRTVSKKCRSCKDYNLKKGVPGDQLAGRSHQGNSVTNR